MTNNNRSAYVAFDIYTSSKGAATHITHMAERLFESYGGGALITLGNKGFGKHELERAMTAHRFTTQIPNYLDRAGVNGTTILLDTVTGDGNGGPSRTTGTQQYVANVALNNAVNTVELVCFNNLKTQIEETTECRFNSLTSNDNDPGGNNPGGDTGESKDLCVAISAKNSNVTTVCF